MYIMEANEMAEKKSEYLTFRTTKEVKEILDAEAKKIDRPISWLLNQIVTEYTQKKKDSGTNIQFTINHNENINL